MIEKALAVTHGEYGFLDHERPDLDLEIIGGWPFVVHTRELAADATTAIVVSALGHRMPTVFGNAEPLVAPRWGIRPSHAYAIVGTRVTSEGARKVFLRDPTGRTNPVLGALRPESPATFEIDLDDAIATFRHIRIVGDDPAGFKEMTRAFEGGRLTPKVHP